MALSVQYEPYCTLATIRDVIIAVVHQNFALKHPAQCNGSEYRKRLNFVDFLHHTIINVTPRCISVFTLVPVNFIPSLCLKGITLICCISL